MIRLVGGGGASSKPELFDEGDKVEANYRGKGRWYPGKVRRTHLDGVYDIDYDDGERETKVAPELVRRIGAGRDRSPARSVRDDSRERTVRSSIRRSRSPDVRDSQKRVSIARRDSRSRSPDVRGSSRKDLPALKDRLLHFRDAERIKDVCKKYQAVADGTCRLAFEEFDESPATGEVTKKEFKSALKTIHKGHGGKVHRGDFDEWIREEDLETLMNSLAYTGVGAVNYDTFLAFALDEPEDEDLGDAHSKLQKNAFTKLNLKAKDILKMFSTSKTFKNGYVRTTEFEKVLLKLNAKITATEIASLQARFDPDKDGTIDFNLFMYWLSAGIPLDELKLKYIHQINSLDDRMLESTFAKAASKGTSLTERDFVEVVRDTFGMVLPVRDIKALYAAMDPKMTGRVPVEDVMKLHELKKGGSSGSKKGTSDLALITPAMCAEIRTAVKTYLEASKKSLGRLILDCCEESTGAINKRQLRKILEGAKIELKEFEETLLFDSLDFTTEGVVAHEDLLVLLMSLTWDNDDVEVSAVIRDTLGKKKVPAKEFFRALHRHDGRGRGYIEHSAFDNVLLKLGGSRVTNDQAADFVRFLDPERTGLIDTGYAAAIVAVLADPMRVEAKIKHALKLMRTKELDYGAHVRASIEASSDGAQLEKAEFLSLFQTFGLPLLTAELDLLGEKHQRRGSINMKKLLEHLENENTLSTTLRASTDKMMSYVNRSGTLGTSMGLTRGGKDLSFGKELFKKICKLRANADRVEEFRRGIFERDSELVGHISKKDIQHVLDHKMDLRDEESALLIENLVFSDGSHRNELDYSFLLLMLLEPLETPPIAAGTAMMAKMANDTDLVSMRRLLDLLFRNCAASDHRAGGLVPYDDVLKVIKNECHGVDPKFTKSVLRAFQDPASDCIYYPEMIAFLGCCSVGNVIKRTRYMEQIRAKQGYNMRDFLKKYAARKASKLDKDKFTDQLQSLGIYFPDTAILLLFSFYGQRGLLNVKAFCEALGDAVDPVAAGMVMSSGPTERKEIAAYEAVKGMCEISEKILTAYDKRIVHFLQLAFDIFDPTDKNVIPAIELERVLRSIGYMITYEEMNQLLTAIDARNTGFLEFNDFMAHVVPFLRA
eukprot:gene20445-23223_t